MTAQSRRAYSLRAAEYAAALGTLADMDPADVARIAVWGRGVNGPILDAGCGPGHWTDALRAQGCSVVGIDIVPEFLARARARFPETSYRLGDLRRPPVPDGGLGGVLAWYSLIHIRPERLPGVLARLGRTLRPGGSLLIGAFQGPHGLAFDHAIATAFFCSPGGLREALETAGLRLAEIRTRAPAGRRPHLDVLALRPGGPGADAEPEDGTEQEHS